MLKIKKIRDELIEEYHWDKYTATFHAIRKEIYNITGFSKVIDKVYNHYARPVYEEINSEKLNKIKNRGRIEFKLSYLIALCSLIGFFVLDPIFSLGVPFGVYLNWRGEIEYFVADDILAKKQNETKNK